MGSGIFGSRAKKKLSDIKAQLVERKQELKEALEELGVWEVVREDGMDIGDQVVSSSIETLNISLQGSEFEEYSMIIKALGMIEDGTYGTCSDCKKPIPEKRLIAYPNASRCLICQEAAEEDGSGDFD